MIWFSKQPEEFPSAVAHAVLSEDTVVHTHYVIRKAVCVSGIELIYTAFDTNTQTEVYLHELLPMRWCMQSESGNWVPYHDGMQLEFENICSIFLSRMNTLKKLEESALLPVLDAFEFLGTVWSVTRCYTQHMLSDVMEEHLFTPQEAIQLLAPILDTLAGLHEAGVYHGGISSNAILVAQDCILLQNFGACFAEGILELSVTTDISDISHLLYQMMTGEETYTARKAEELPPGLQKTLRMGMAGEIQSIPKLWKLLHVDRPAKRNRTLIHGQARKSGILNIRTTLIFCIICCLVPIEIQFAAGRNLQLDSVAYQRAEDSICVPELLECSREDAVQQAEALGLHIIITGREGNPTVPENHIITQIPNAGAVLHAGDTIAVTLSDGWSNYVPNVCNSMLEDAVSTLEALGFQVEYTETESPNDVPGSVMTQDIPPNTRLERGSTIHLTVSLGRADLDPSKLETVSNYVGMDFDTAKQQLSALYLYAFQAKAVYSKEIPAGVVIAQQIPEGKQVPQGTIINMVVSLGEEMARVPSVEMMYAASAREQLEAVGLKAVFCYVSNGAYSMDYVLSQNVASGELIPIGSEVWLTVSIGRESYVESTGGWSGNPLPTVEVTETTEVTEETIETQEEEWTEEPSEELPSQDVEEESETVPEEIPTEEETQEIPSDTEVEETDAPTEPLEETDIGIS